MLAPSIARFIRTPDGKRSVSVRYQGNHNLKVAVAMIRRHRHQKFPRSSAAERRLGSDQVQIRRSPAFTSKPAASFSMVSTDAAVFEVSIWLM